MFSHLESDGADQSELTGKWGKWKESICSEPCNGGTKKRTRSCKNSSNIISECIMRNGGKASEEMETVACNQRSCPGKCYLPLGEVFWFPEEMTS